MHHVTKFIILISRKRFSNYIAQNNYLLIIQTKLLIALFFRNNLEITVVTKDCSKFS